MPLRSGAGVDVTEEEGAIKYFAAAYVCAAEGEGGI